MRAQRGHAPAIEAAIIIPGLVLLVGLIVVLAQLALADQELRGIAAHAARTAALERSPVAAQARASEAIEQGLGEHGMRCTDRSSGIDVGGLASSPGTSATVTVRLTCVVALAEVGLPGLPGHITLEATGVSPVDRYRAR